MAFTAPKLWVGTRTAKLLAATGSGYTDDGVDVVLTDRSERIAFAGAGGECIYTALYVTTRHFASNVSFAISVIVDSATVYTTTLSLTGGTSAGVRQTHELLLSMPYTVGGVEQLRVAPRGTWIELLVTSGTPAAKQIIEEIEVEFEVVRESMSGEAR